MARREVLRTKSGSSQDWPWRSQSTAPAHASRFEFDDLTLDLRVGSVRRGEDVLKLEPRSYDVLVCLVQHAGELVSRDALLDTIWRGIHVSPHSLTQAVLQLRQAIGDHPRRPRFIETVHRRGYRFIAPVRATATRRAGPDDEQARQPSIAVLPFADLSPGGEYEWFADGLSEEIIHALAQISDLKVIARTSAFAFRKTPADVRQIAEALGVDTVLEGSVRRAANRVRVTGQLVSGHDGRHLWSDQLDGDTSDVFAIQETIAGAIANALKARLTAGAPSRGTSSVAAHEAYLEARHHFFMGTQSLDRFKACLDRAVALDPDFALAHSLAAAFFTASAWRGLIPANEAMPSARALASKALRGDAAPPEAHALLGIVAGQYDYDWVEAERHFRDAIARAAGSRDVVFWFGNHYLLPTGRVLEAVDAMRYGLETDPLNLLYRHHLAVGLWHADRRDDAEAELRRALALDEHYALAQSTLGMLQAQQGRFSEALALTEKAHAAVPENAVTIGALAALLVRAGDNGRGIRLIDQLTPGHAYGAPIGVALFHAMRGETDRAFEWAARAIEQRFPPIVHILRPLLGRETGWAELAQMMNLTAATPPSATG